MEDTQQHARINQLSTEIELMKKDIVQYGRIFDKIDQTNEKLQDLINSMGKIVSLHEQKFVSLEKELEFTQDELVSLKLDQQQRIRELEQFKWKAGGGYALLLVVIGFIITILF